MPYSTVPFRMTLSDLAKYSVQSEHNLCALSSLHMSYHGDIDITFHGFITLAIYSLLCPKSFSLIIYCDTSMCCKMFLG